MPDFSNIDPNFRVEPALDVDGLVYRDALDPSFSLLGVTFESGCYRRMPAAVARSVSEEVDLLHTHTAGGCLAFVTDSKRITLRATMHNVEKMPHFALTGSGGFDLYERRDGAYHYLTTFIPPFGLTDGFSAQRVLEDRRERELRLYFPLYSGVTVLSIGVEPGCALRPVTCKKPPMVFYGSSITQGGCASKPGNAFPAMVSHLLDLPHINLGFSGSCKGETEMAAYLSALPMRAFVCGYDHNAPTLAHLERTHLPLVQAVREGHPDIPIVLFGRPKAVLSQEEQARRKVIENTCAAVNGILIPNEALIPPQISPWATVDGVHPNDLGFYHMAKAIADRLACLFGKESCL